MVLLGEEGLPLLVLDWTGPIPSSACFAPYRFRGRCLRTGRTGEVVVRQSEMAEVLDLPERNLTLVCRQDGDLVLLDPASGEVACVPEDQASLRAVELEPGTAVRVRFHEGRAVWVGGR
jgi:translation elongation factor P/translation initiation factor 5A